MNRDGKDELVVLAVHVVKVVAPDVFDVPRVHEAVTIRRFLDEHHGRQVVNVPIAGNLDETCFLTLHQRFHPMVGVLAVIDLGPGVTSA